VFLSLFSGLYVWKNAAVGWESVLFLQYGEGTMPYAEASLPRLIAQQPYDVSLQLLVPASGSNLGLGNFMAFLELSTPSNQTLTSVRRPALVTPRSASTLWSILRTPDTVRLNIPLLQAYVMGTSNVIAKLNLGRKDGWTSLGTGQGRELSVISATLTGTIHHEGVRGLVNRFPLVFGFVASATFFSIAFLTVAAILFSTVEWHLYRDSNDSRSTKDVGKMRRSHSWSDEEKPARKSRSAHYRSRSTKSSRPRSARGPDGPNITILKTPDQAVPLRRRQSRFGVYADSE